MREHILVRTVRALVAVAILSQFSQNQVCRAAFLNVFGGPTYSDATGGYRAEGIGYGSRLPATSFFIDTFYFGTVNNAGVAVGNVVRYDTPLSSTPQNVYPSVATWSATSSPVILSSGSSTTGGQAHAMNDAGTAVGLTLSGFIETRATGSSSGNYPNSISEAVLWNTPAPGLTSLNYLGSPGSTSSPSGNAYAINAQGISVGSVTKYDFSGNYQGIHPVSWNVGSTTPTELGGPNSNPGAAFGINSAGTVVGKSMVGTSSEAVRWDASGTIATMLDNLGTPAGKSSDAAAVTINDSGTAVGYVTKFAADGTSLGPRAVRWDAGGTVATELGNLGTDANGKTQYVAIGINNAGVIFGNGNLTPQSNLGSLAAIRWDPGSTTAIRLAPFSATPLLDGHLPNTYADAINSQGLIVGWGETVSQFGPFVRSSGFHAAYWNPDGSIVDLNSLIDPASGWTLTQATAISDTGWILGVGSFDPDGAGGQSSYQRLFLVQVPEPSSLVLLVLGSIGGLASVMRRRSKH